MIYFAQSKIVEEKKKEVPKKEKDLLSMRRVIQRSFIRVEISI